MAGWRYGPDLSRSGDCGPSCDRCCPMSRAAPTPTIRATRRWASLAASCAGPTSWRGWAIWRMIRQWPRCSGSRPCPANPRFRGFLPVRPRGLRGAFGPAPLGVAGSGRAGRGLYKQRRSDLEDRKGFVYQLARFVKAFRFLTNFFSFAAELKGFAVFAEYIGPQLIKKGSVSDLQGLEPRSHRHPAHCGAHEPGHDRTLPGNRLRPARPPHARRRRLRPPPKMHRDRRNGAFFTSGPMRIPLVLTKISERPEII